MGGLRGGDLSHKSGIGLFRRNLAVWRCCVPDQALDVAAKGALTTSMCLAGPTFVNRTRRSVPATDRPSVPMARPHALRSFLSGLYLLSSSRHLEQRFSAGLTMVALYPLAGQSEQSFRQCQTFEPTILLYTGKSAQGPSWSPCCRGRSPERFRDFRGQKCQTSGCKEHMSHGRLPEKRREAPMPLPTAINSWLRAGA